MKSKKRMIGHDADHQDIANSLYHLGRVSYEKSMFDDAEKWFNQCYQMLKRLYGENVDHPDIATCLHQLGIVAEKVDTSKALKW